MRRCRLFKQTNKQIRTSRFLLPCKKSSLQDSFMKKYRLQDSMASPKRDCHQSHSHKLILKNAIHHLSTCISFCIA